MAHDIFICYAQEDKVIADAVCAELERRGLRCWYAARDVRQGEDEIAARARAVDDSRLLVLVFTEKVNGSAQVLGEICNAADDRTPIFPFRLTGVAPADNLKYYLGGVNWIDAVGKDAQKSLRALGDACEKQLQGAGAAGGSNKWVKILAAVLVVAVLAFAGVKLFAKGDGGRSGASDNDTGDGQETTTTEKDNLQCTLPGMTCEAFESRFAGVLADLGTDLGPFELAFYDNTGERVAGGDAFYTVELSLSEEAAGEVSRDDLLLRIKAMLLASFTGEDLTALDDVADRLMHAYDRHELAVNDAIDGYRIYCNFTQKIGRAHV